MQDKKQFVSILFSDIEGFSKIQEEHLIVEVNKINTEIINNILNSENHFFYNTWGDAFFICSYDPVDLANIALDIRDKFKNTNWKRIGFDKNLRIRIGIHMEKVTVVYDRDKVKNVIGHHITSTARIEPVVKPNHIYTSEFFYKHLLSEKNINFKFVDIGRKKLAKDFGDESLYELIREYESDNTKLENETFQIPKIQVKKEVTQKELNDLLKETLFLTQQYFEEAIKQIQIEHPEIEASFTKTKSDLKAELYMNGQYKNECRIWYGDEFGSKGIYYSEGKSFDQKSFHECITAENNGFETTFQALMGHHFGQFHDGKIPKPEKVSEYLWMRFTQALTY